VLFGDTALEVVNFAVRKLAHFVEYAILAALTWRADRRVLVALGVALAVAVVDETQQAFTMFRTGSPFDVLLDCAGAATALAFLRWRRPPPPLPT
jgi:VanZ family protein